MTPPPTRRPGAVYFRGTSAKAWLISRTMRDETESDPPSAEGCAVWLGLDHALVVGARVPTRGRTMGLVPPQLEPGDGAEQ